MKIKTETIHIEGMVCNSCENIIKKNIKKIDGIEKVETSFKKSIATVTYDSEKCSYDSIIKAIIKGGYSVKKTSTKKEIILSFFKNAILIAGLIFIMAKLSTISNFFNTSAILDSNATYFIIFIVGVISSFHCIGMCGGLMLSQSLGQKNIKSSLYYNIGRVISYTILGGIIGAIGSALSVSTQTTVIIYMFAGIFMIIHGTNTMGFKILRGLNFKIPFLSKCSIKSSNSTPFVVGLLNGFMPCGPLQTMQLFALSSGNAFNGALSMFIFSVGTVPLMLLFGHIANRLNRSTSQKLIKFSGALIIVLGLITANRGLVLSGININPLNNSSSQTIKENSNYNTGAKSEEEENNNQNYGVATIKDGVQTVKITADYYGYTPSIVYIQKEIPTRFIIEGKQLSGCNNSIIIPSLNIQKELQEGENIIEFIPEGSGSISYSCWMGMIGGNIEVLDNLDSIKP